MNVIKHVAIQLRKSRADGDTDETLLNHKTICIRLCEERGYTYDIYQEVLSGASRLEDRPELMEMLKNIEANKYDAVVTTELSRLARSGQYSMLIADILTEANCLIITPKETIDLTINSQRLMYDIQSAVNTSELRTTNLRMRNAIIEKAKRGEYVSSIAPLGYTAVRVNKKRTLEINEDASIIRTIYDLAESGRGLRDIAKQVGKSYKSVHNILTNKQYTGTLLYNMKDKKGNITEAIEVPEAFPAIISTNQWDKVQEAIKSRIMGDLDIKYRSRGEVRTILKDLIYCQCGSKLGFQKNGDEMILKRCIRCGMKGLAEQRLVQEFYKQFKFVEEHFTEQWQKALEIPLEDNKEQLVQQVKGLSKQRDRLSKKLVKIRSAYLDEVFTKEEYLAEKASTEEELKVTDITVVKLEKEIANLDTEAVAKGYEDKLKLIGLVKKAIPEIGGMVKGVGITDTTDDAPKERTVIGLAEANRLLKLLIDRITYVRHEEKIVGSNELGEPEIEHDVIELTIAPK
ncbi:recombinase family protein [Bacillus sp. EB93]|nr:recombinase family protein [Peribacillus frigoritolerans]